MIVFLGANTCHHLVFRLENPFVEFFWLQREQPSQGSVYFNITSQYLFKFSL